MSLFKVIAELIMGPMYYYGNYMPVETHRDAIRHFQSQAYEMQREIEELQNANHKWEQRTKFYSGQIHVLETELKRVTKENIELRKELSDTAERERTLLQKLVSIEGDRSENAGLCSIEGINPQTVSDMHTDVYDKIKNWASKHISKLEDHKIAQKASHHLNYEGKITALIKKALLIRMFCHFACEWTLNYAPFNEIGNFPDIFSFEAYDEFMFKTMKNLAGQPDIRKHPLVSQLAGHYMNSAFHVFQHEGLNLEHFDTGCVQELFVDLVVLRINMICIKANIVTRGTYICDYDPKLMHDSRCEPKTHYSTLFPGIVTKDGNVISRMMVFGK